MISSLLGCVDDEDRVRLVMEQYLLTADKWLPKDHEQRDDYLRLIFPRSLLQHDGESPPPAGPLVILS